MRKIKTLSVESQAIMQQGQKLYRDSGMQRSVGIAASAVVAMKFRRLAKESGIDERERYLSPRGTELGARGNGVDRACRRS